MQEAPTARYWRDHLRNTVQFAEGMARVAEAEPSMVIEMGPTASLLGMGRRCVPKLDAAWLPSLRQGQNDWQVLAASVAEYYVRGGQFDWRAWDRPWKRERLLLPNYPFQFATLVHARRSPPLAWRRGRRGGRDNCRKFQRASALGHEALHRLDEHAFRNAA
jgi:acyl transferase domain-containing protein